MAPLPDKLTLSFKHIELLGLDVALTFGKGFTVTVWVAILVQPVEAVPVTVYVVVVVGENDELLLTPPLQAYNTAPAPFNVALSFKQIGALGETEAVTVGNC